MIIKTISLKLVDQKVWSKKKKDMTLKIFQYNGAIIQKEIPRELLKAMILPGN